MGADNTNTTTPADKTKKPADGQNHPDGNTQQNTDKAATTAVTDAQKAMKEHGAEAAYAALKTDYDNFVKATGGNQAQDKAYWDQVTKGLGNLLPQVSIAWGEDHVKTSHKTVDQATLKAEQHSSNPLEATMAASLASQAKDVKISPDGHIVTHFADGTSQSLNPKDNTVVTQDAKGRATSVHYADGHTRSFAYDDKTGALKQITETDGKVYKEQNGKWVGPDGKDAPFSNPKVLNDGTYSNQTVEGKILSTTAANGKSQINPDGSMVHLDANNRPTEIDYKDGKRAQFGYDDQGHVNKVVSPDGVTATLQNGKWLDAKGQDTGMSDVRVQADGSYMFKSKDNMWHVLSTQDKQQTFSQQSLDQAAKDIHEAANHKKFGISVFGAGIGDPEVDKIQNILEPMSAAQRQLVSEAFNRQNHGKTLAADLQDNLSAPDYAHMQAIMKRQDGVADNTGQVWQAVAKLKEMGPAYPGFMEDARVRTEKEIRDSINTLTADQLKAVEAKYKQDYGQDLQSSLLNNPNISAESKEALKIYFKGNDQIKDEDRLQLADLAIKRNRPDIFDETFRDASQTARDKFIASGGIKRIDATFGSGDAQIAKDYVNRGTVSLATIVDGDTHWYHTNKDDISRAAANATPQDRKDFIRGEQLAESKQTPTTDDDKRALAFYQSVDKAMHNAGNKREAAEWESKLRNNESVLTNILDSHNDGSWFFSMGAGTDKNKEFSAVENMKPEDWKFLKEHPQEVDKIEKALRTFDDSHHDEVMNMLRAKLAPNITDFAASQKVGNRSVDQRLKDSDSDSSARVDALTGMSQSERQQYANNTNGFRDKINKLLKSDEEKALADQISKTTGDTTAVEKVLIDHLKNNNPAGTFADMEAAFKADPTLRSRMDNPQTADDKKLSQYFHNAADAAVDKAGLGAQSYGEGGYYPGRYDEYKKAIFKDGHVPLNLQLSLAQDTNERNNLIINCNDDERARLLNKNPDAATKTFQDSVFGDNKDARQALTFGLQQKDPKTGKPGYLDPADQFKLFVAQDNSGNSDQMKSMLEGMTPEQRQDLANKYFTKYGKLVTEDCIGKFPADQQWRVRELMAPTDANVRQVALDAQLSNDSHTSNWDTWMKNNWDYTRVSADSTQDNMQKFVAAHAAEIDKLTPEQKKQFDDAVNNYVAASKAYVDSKGQMAEAVVDATITLAAIGGAFFSGGTSLALLAEVGVGGAILRTAMMKDIQGSDFDSSVQNILKQSFEGGTAAMLGFLGPEALGLKGLAVGEDVAAITAGKLVEGAGTKALFKEGSEQVLKEGLAQISRQGAIAGDKEIAALAEKLAADGVDKTMVEQAIKQQLKTDVMSGMKNVVMNEADAYVRNLVAAQIGVQGKELAATAVGFESPDTLFDRMKGAAISATAGVTLFHGVFRTAQVGGDYFKVALGKNAEGMFVAGGGTTVRHADGRMEVVSEGKILTLKPGDTIPENMGAKRGAWGAAVKDAQGAVQHFEDGTGQYTRVPDKPNTWIDASGKEHTLTNVKVNTDGSLEYTRDGKNYHYNGQTGELTHPGAQPPVKPDLPPVKPEGQQPPPEGQQPPPEGQQPPPEGQQPPPEGQNGPKTKPDGQEPVERLTPDELKKRVAEQEVDGREFLAKRLGDNFKAAADNPAFKGEISAERAALERVQAALKAGNVEEASKILRELPQPKPAGKDPWVKDGTIPKGKDPAEFLQGKIDSQTAKLNRWDDLVDGNPDPATAQQMNENLMPGLKSLAQIHPELQGVVDGAQKAVDAFGAGGKTAQMAQFFAKIDPNGKYRISPLEAIESQRPGYGAYSKEQLVDALLKPGALDSLPEGTRATVEAQLKQAKANIEKALTGRPVTSDATDLPSSYGSHAPEGFNVENGGKEQFVERLKKLGIDPEDPKNKIVKDFLSGDSRATDYKIVRNENGDTMLMRFDKSDGLNQSKAYALVLNPQGEPVFKGPDGKPIPKLHITFNSDGHAGGNVREVKIELGGDNKPAIYDRDGLKQFDQVDWTGSGFANGQEFIDYLNNLFKEVKYPGDQ